MVVVASALVVSAGVGKSGATRRVVRRLEPHMRTTGRQVAILTVGVTLLSTFMKNIGALAIVIALVVLWRLVNLGFARFAIQPVASEGLGQRDRFMKYPTAGLLGRPRAPPRLLVRLGRSWPKWSWWRSCWASRRGTGSA